MKTSLLIVFALLVVICGVTFVSRIMDDDEQPVSMNDSNAKLEASKNEGQPDNVAKPIHRAEEAVEVALLERNDARIDDSTIARRFQNSRSASEAFDAITLAQQEGREDLALWAESKLFNMCEGMDGDRTAMFEETIWAFEKLKAFCSDYGASMTEGHRESLRNDESYVVRRERDAIAKVVEGLNYNDRLSVLTEYIATSNSPFEIAAAFQYLKNEIRDETQPLPNLGQNENTTRDDLLNSVGAASLVMQCRLSGGCPPGSPTMIDICANSPQCSSTWGIEDYFSTYLSPFQLEQLLKILNQLQSEAPGG